MMPISGGFMEAAGTEAAKVLLAALVNAGLKRLTAFMEEWSAKRSEDTKQQHASEWVSKHYTELRDAVTNNSMKVLAATEFGASFRRDQLRALLHPELDLDHQSMMAFDLEFHYRLEYLVLLGLLTSGMREYRITRLGVAFLAAARERSDYASALAAPTTPQ